MLKKDFDKFISNLREGTPNLGVYSNFRKIEEKSDNINKELRLLNKALEQEDPVDGILNIVREYQETLSVIPKLVGIRDEIINSNNKIYNFQTKEPNYDDIEEFIYDTGLGNFLKSRKITDFVNYYAGIESGLDSNARKNRIGYIMEEIVFEILKTKKIDVKKQVSARKINNIFDNFIDAKIIDNLFIENQKSDKKFDFAFIFKDKLFLVECNYYSSNGSKLNETARSYEELNNKINKYDKIKFIWITDGQGWKESKNQLKQAYKSIKYLFNLNDLENNSLEELL